MGRKQLNIWFAFCWLIKLAEELSDKDDDNSEKDVDDHDNGSDNYDDDRTDGIKDITKQLLQFGIKEQEMEEPENPYEQEPDKIKIHEWVASKKNCSKT